MGGRRGDNSQARSFNEFYRRLIGTEGVMSGLVGVEFTGGKDSNGHGHDYQNNLV